MNQIVQSTGPDTGRKADHPISDKGPPSPNLSARAWHLLNLSLTVSQRESRGYKPSVDDSEETVALADVSDRDESSTKQHSSHGRIGSVARG